MKKYFAAAAVAVMVFAFAAFAASLDVDGGTLQAGSDDLACAEAVFLTYDWGATEDNPDHYIQEIVADLNDPAGASEDLVCEGKYVQLDVRDANGELIGASHEQISSGRAVFAVNDAPVADVEDIYVVVHSQEINWTWGIFD